MLQNCKNATLLLRNACFQGCWAVPCTSFSQTFRRFFCVAVKISFLCDFCRFGPPKGSLFKPIFADFADFAWKRACWNWGLKNDAVLALICKGRRQRRGLSSYADSAELAMDFITPCSPFGGAANLKASPLPPAPLSTSYLVTGRTCKIGRTGRTSRLL